MRDAEAAALIEQDHAAVAVQPFFQVLHRFLHNRVGSASGTHFVRSPLGQDQFHDGFAPAGAGAGSAEIIGVTAAANQRRVADASGSFVERSAG